MIATICDIVHVGAPTIITGFRDYLLARSQKSNCRASRISIVGCNITIVKVFTFFCSTTHMCAVEKVIIKRYVFNDLCETETTLELLLCEPLQSL